jgi:hypothetical protein
MALWGFFACIPEITIHKKPYFSLKKILCKKSSKSLEKDKILKNALTNL